MIEAVSRIDMIEAVSRIDCNRLLGCWHCRYCCDNLGLIPLLLPLLVTSSAFDAEPPVYSTLRVDNPYSIVLIEGAPTKKILGERREANQ